MLQSPQGKPIKSWPLVQSKSRITDKLGELKAEKQFLLETRGEAEPIQSSQEDVEKKIERKEAGKVYIVPTLQMNVIGYREDEQTFLKMLSEFVIGNSDTRMRLATGYLNLQKEFMREILKSDFDGKVQLLTSSPRANGFYKGGFVKKYIPGMYRANEEILLKQVKGDNVHMFEYEKGDWTFHGKGAWLYEENADKKSEVSMSIIGSSNFSYRSNRRDTECQLYIVSECEDLKQRLHDESQHLFDNAKKVDLKTVQNDGIDKLNWKERMLNKLLNSFI